MEYFKYELIKPYKAGDNTMPQGTVIHQFRGAWYVNGGMVSPSWYPLIEEIISNDDYVKKLPFVKNEL